MATDEQIERVRQLTYVVKFDGDSAALQAVLEELTSLRKLAEAVEEHEQAAKHDRLKESGFARHNAARRTLDAAHAEYRQLTPTTEQILAAAEQARSRGQDNRAVSTPPQGT